LASCALASVENINTLILLVHQIKKEIGDAAPLDESENWLNPGDTLNIASSHRPIQSNLSR
jgi:hypothetical protein